MARQKSYDSQSPSANKMAVTMALFWVSLVLSIVGSSAEGEFSILHSPDSLKFSGSFKTHESLLKEIFSACMGFSVQKNSQWKGLYVVDPFNTPEAVVEVYIDGVSSLGDTAGLKAKTFPLIVDEYEPDTFQAVQHRITQRFTNGGNNIVNVKLYENEVNVFGKSISPKVTKLSLAHLKYGLEEDYQFLNELETLRVIIGRINSGAIVADNLVDFYNFRFRTLHALSDYHGPNSLQTKEAKKLLTDALQDLSKAFVKVYDGSVLVTAVTTDVAHTRRAVRSVEGSSPGNVEKQEISNADDGYSADYPAVFNILLWFGIVMAFTIIAIVYAIMDMDPGRDSIIYRMTSTRMKKDN